MHLARIALLLLALIAPVAIAGVEKPWEIVTQSGSDLLIHLPDAIAMAVPEGMRSLNHGASTWVHLYSGPDEPRWSVQLTMSPLQTSREELINLLMLGHRGPVPVGQERRNFACGDVRIWLVLYSPYAEQGKGIGRTAMGDAVVPGFKIKVNLDAPESPEVAIARTVGIIRSIASGSEPRAITSECD